MSTPTTLLHSPAQILRVLLLELSAGTSPSDDIDWPIYVSSEPSQPDNCLTIYDTSPKVDGRMNIDGEQLEHNGFQIRIRSSDYPTGYTKARAIEATLLQEVYRNLVSLSNTQGDASYLVECVVRTNLLSLGKDTPKTKRNLFTVNGLISITRET